MVRNDLGPSIQATLKLNDNTTPDLTGSTVKFYMKDDNGVVVIDGHDATIIDPLLATIVYNWQAGETDLVGPCHGEFKVTKAGITQTYPMEDDFVIRFRESN